MTTKLVHVIKPSGTRFEFTFLGNTTNEQILSQLDTIKARFGYNGTVKKVDPNLARVTNSMVEGVDWADEKSGFAYDHAETVVVIGRDENGQFVEIERIKGPKAPTPV